jgi:hypothetical protein
MLELSQEALDVLTQAATGYSSFEELLDLKHRHPGGWPLLDRQDPATRLLADLYDAAQERLGDPRRAWRGSGGQVDGLHIPAVIRKARQERPFLGLD